MKPRANVSKTITELYGTGHFNPRSFDHKPSRSRRRLYAWALGLFLLAVALATFMGLYLFARTPDSFTGDRVSLFLEGNTSVSIGKDEVYALRVNNGEEVDLTNAAIFIGYTNGYNPSPGEPSFSIIKAGEGAKAAANPNTWIIGAIKQGETKIFPLTLRFSGQENSRVGVQFYLSFQPKDFSSSLSAKLEQSFTLGQSAVGFNIQGPNAAGSGSEVTLTIGIDKKDDNNIDVADWLLSFSLPDNFKLLAAEPAQNNKDPYRVGELPEEGGMHKLVLRGTVSGKAGDNIKVGAALRQGENGAAINKEKIITIQSTAAAVTIASTPAQGKKLQWNEELRYQVKLTNNGGAVLSDVSVSLVLGGENYWRSDSMQISDKGFFEGGNIIWDKTTMPGLAEIKPQESQTLSFSLSSRAEPPANISGLPAFTAKATLRAKVGDEEVVVMSEENTAAILANIELDSVGSYASGPNPPLPGQETAFNITWQLGPTSSELKSAVWSAVLPKGVKWRNQAEYSLGELKYDESKNRVEWKASKITKLTEPIKISFQIGATPSGEVTNSYLIFDQTSFSATDSLAGEVLELFTTPVKLSDIK